MAEKITMPSFGKTVDQGIIVQWLKTAGDEIKTGENLLEVTIDKASYLVESPACGTIVCTIAEPGDLVPSNAVIGMIGSADETKPIDLESIKYPKALFDSCLLFRSTLDAPQPNCEVSELNAMRKVIAERMSNSKDHAPHFYVSTKIDMTGCYKLRKKLKAEKKRVSYNDMILKAAGLALAEFPTVAALYENGNYIHRSEMHVGFAVAIEPDGLEVPVIRNADKLSLIEVSEQAKILADKARNKKLLPDDFSGSVFTVSNLGSFEVDSFTAIINPGESAILAIGKIIDTPVAEKGEVIIKPIMNITLSSDHRTIDGVLAARFNGYLKKILESAENLY
ncbi:MAG: dihydrolipoamide acetyltransferase family protein [Planctomycetota bacterium]|jgi:pyruvate/2-oxoglutarate dehydrogenase complex dihydrolipoamide acyltransferase (E2) component